MDVRGIASFPMLARAEPSLPRGPGWIYEPKWDGFRAHVHVGAHSVRITGRNGGSLDGSFPDLRSAVRAAVPPNTTLDGEVVVMRDGVLDFAALLRGPRERPPATFIAFDLLRHEDEDIRPLPLSERRARLVRTISDSPAVCVTPQCEDPEVAQGWVDELAPVGVEGIVAKLAREPYRPGKRSWVKVRRFDTLDVVVGGYRGSRTEATSLLLGLYDESGCFRYIGQTGALPEEQRSSVARVLEALAADESFTSRVQPGQGRWENQRFEDWVAVEPVLVCEIAYSRLDGGFLRHPAKIMRWRPDKDPRDCALAGLDAPDQPRRGS